MITCLEVLAPATNKHIAAVQALTDFKARVEAQLAKATDTEERDALEALIREIEFKKETSIRRRVRNLVLAQAPVPRKSAEGCERL